MQKIKSLEYSEFAKKYFWMSLFAGLVFLSMFTAKAHAQSYVGQNGAVAIGFPGCNSASFTPVPGSQNLFISRHRITSTGGMAGVSGPNDCSGGLQWGLTLVQLDWTKKQFTLVKPLLDTSVNNAKKLSQAVISGGPMKGAIIKSAYDPNMVVFNGQYLVSFECVLSEFGPNFGVDGTSSCLSVYDPVKQTIDLSQTQVIVSGNFSGSGAHHAASVPSLLVFQNTLYVYWSALEITNNTFTSIAMRGAAIDKTSNGFVIRNSGGKLVKSTDPLTTEVWGPNANDPFSNSSIDSRLVWVSGKSVVALAAKGGNGCVSPDGTSKGCFKMAISKSTTPLGYHIFNNGIQAASTAYPSNAQEYTTPITGPDGSHWFLGHFYKPVTNGYSEYRPVPNAQVWQTLNRGEAIIAFPNTDTANAPN